MQLLYEKSIFTIVNIKDLFTISRRFVVIGDIKLELLNEITLYKKGCYKRVKRWFRGAHPTIGIIIKGFTGVETVVEQDVIIPMVRFRVID
jgi:hypothetical protein